MVPLRPRLFSVCLGFVALSVPAWAQREGGGPPTQDPFGRKTIAAPVQAIGRYRSHRYQGGILSVQSTDGATLRIRPWATGVVRIEYYPAGQPVRPDSSLSVVQPQARWQPPRYPHEGPEPGMPARASRDLTAGGVQETATALTWPTDRQGHAVVIEKNPLRLRYERNGAPLVADAGGPFAQPGRAGGAGVALRLAPDEHLYGTGARALPLDRRGRRLSLYNEAHYAYQNGEPTLNMTLPTVLSSRGYLLFFDHHTAATLDLGATTPDVLEYRGEGLPTLGYFIVSGETQAQILSRYTALTGRQPLPPRWGLGLLQSRFGYKSETEMLQVARRMRQAGFPLDALILDLYWFGGTRQQGDFRWEPTGFPDPARLTRRLDSLGVQTLLISEPYVMRTSRHDALVRQQQLVGRDTLGRPYTVASFWAGPATLLDMYRPAARQWLWQQYDRLKQQDGVQGWWSDLGEPENQPADMVYDLGPTRRIHNGYGQAWASILSEGYARQYPRERLFNLARSGWAGVQRHSVFPWSGDVQRTWSGLQAQVPIMLSAGLGGVGYMHSDAGGFCVGPTDPELYTRWLQMASLGPILRPHGEGVPPEPYWWPAATQAAVRPYAHLRYQLLPYLYSLAWENSQTGTPLARPMSFGPTQLLPESVMEPPTSGLSAEGKAAGMKQDGPPAAESAPADARPARPHAVAALPDASVADNPESAPLTRQWNWYTGASSAWGAEQLRAKQRRAFAAEHDPALANVNDQFMLGPSLLVAPVLQPGQRRRNVALPPGRWLDFDSHETLPGGRTVGRPAPLRRLPLLVRAGALLPLAPYRPSTARYAPDTLHVRYYADPTAGPSSFVVYEDDGRTAPTAAAGYQLVVLQGQTTAAEVRFTARLVGKPYAGAPARRTLELLIPRVPVPPAAAPLANGQPLPATAWQHDASTRTLRLRLALDTTAQGRTVALRLPGLRLDTTAARHLAPEPLTLETPADRTFRGQTTLRYTVHQPGPPPALRLLNGRGQVVRTLPTAPTAGPHELPWDARDAQGRPVPGGIYWAELAGQRQRLVVLPPL